MAISETKGSLPWCQMSEAIDHLRVVDAVGASISAEVLATKLRCVMRASVKLSCTVSAAVLFQCAENVLC